MTRIKIYLVLQTVACVALAALMSLSASGIYRDGAALKAQHPLESVYTPEAVAERFAPIAPLFFAGVGLLIAGLALGVKDQNAEKPVKDAELSRNMLISRVAHPSERMISERRRQKRINLFGWGVFALSMVPLLVYMLDPDHFPESDLESMFINLARVFLPWAVVGLGARLVTSILCERSVIRETQAARECLNEERAANIAAVGTVDPPKRTAVARVIIILAAIAFILAGVLNGSAKDVLYKAISICTECIGLG